MNKIIMENLNHPKSRLLISESDLGLTGIPSKNIDNVCLALTLLLKKNPFEAKVF
ncbi:MAG: hypothetical protein KAI83_14435 [Thiomargarita sp.]|nr:hypothetical protein [Thiomargarita sp.]